MGHDKIVLDFVFLFILAGLMIPLRILPAENAGGALQRSCTPQPHSSFKTLMRKREKHSGLARRGQPSHHFLENLRNPAVSSFTHDPIPFFTLLYDPMSSVVNQQLQCLPLRARDGRTDKTLGSILSTALHDYRCPFARHCIP